MQTDARFFEGGGYGQSAVDAVYMKSITPVCSAERQTIVSNQLAMPLLRPFALSCEDRMTVPKLRDDFFLIDRAVFIQCHTERMPRLDVLQNVHIVCQRGMI